MIFKHRWIVGEHEIKKKSIFFDDTSLGKKYECIRCGKLAKRKQDFNNLDCHECDCKFCER